MISLRKKLFQLRSEQSIGAIIVRSTRVSTKLKIWKILSSFSHLNWQDIVQLSTLPAAHALLVEKCFNFHRRAPTPSFVSYISKYLFTTDDPTHRI